MTSILFCTKEPIDRSAFTMFGVSAKTTSNPIGKFGTGLKYAVAICARLGVEFILYTREQGPWLAERLSTQPLSVRNQEFTAMKLGELVLPFSTHLGCNWKLWQAVRELKANTEDEGGEFMFRVDGDNDSIDFEYLAGLYQTIIMIRDSSLNEIAENWQHYFPEIEPLHTANNIEIFENLYDAPTGIYNHGYLIYTPNKPLRYSYNFLGEVDLTEDRTAANQEKLLSQARSALLVNSWDIDEEIFLENFYGEYNENYIETYFHVWDGLLYSMKSRVSDNISNKLTNYLQRVEMSTIRELSTTPKLEALLAQAIEAVLPIWPDLPKDQLILATVTSNHGWDNRLYINITDDFRGNVYNLIQLLDEHLSSSSFRDRFAEALCQLHAAVQTAEQGGVSPSSQTVIYTHPDADNVVVEHGELTYTALKSSVLVEPAIVMGTGSPIDEGVDTVSSESRESFENSKQPDYLEDETEFDLPPSERTGRLDPELTKDDIEDDEHEFYSEGAADRDPMTPHPADPDDYIPDERNTPEPDYSFKE